MLFRNIANFLLLLIVISLIMNNVIYQFKGRSVVILNVTLLKNLNKKYFYPYVGEGLRYEIKDFVSSVLSKEHVYPKLSKHEILAMCRVQEQYQGGVNVYNL